MASNSLIKLFDSLYLWEKIAWEEQKKKKKHAYDESILMRD